MRNFYDHELEDEIVTAVYGSTEAYEDALERDAPHALELQRGLLVRLNTKDREQIEKTLSGIVHQLMDGPLRDVNESFLPPDFMDHVDSFATRLSIWKNQSLFELLGDLQRALASDTSEKVKEARLDSLVRAVKEVINWQPAPKPTAAKAEPQPEPMAEKFRTALSSATA